MNTTERFLCQPRNLSISLLDWTAGHRLLPSVWSLVHLECVVSRIIADKNHSLDQTSFDYFNSMVTEYTICMLNDVYFHFTWAEGWPMSLRRALKTCNKSLSLSYNYWITELYYSLERLILPCKAPTYFNFRTILENYPVWPNSQLIVHKEKSRDGHIRILHYSGIVPNHQFEI